MDAIQVKSLRSRIVLQFVAIIVPITIVLLYQAVSDARHAERLRASLELTRLAQEAKDSYKTFIDGVRDR